MSPAINDTGISFSEISKILHRHRLLILATFFLTIAVVVACTLVIPKQYETRMKVLVRNERADMIVSPDRNGASDFRSEVSEAQINSEVELLTSDNLLRDVVAKCRLDNQQHAAEPAVAIEKALKRLHSNLKVTPVHKANIILVKYTDTDQRRAVAVLASLSNLYLEEHLKVHGTPGSYQFFKGQAERYRQELEYAESSLADFRRRENIVMPAQQTDVILQKAAEAESALMQVDAAISEYTQKIAGIQRQLAAAPARVVTQSRTLSNQYSVERLSTMLAELQNRRTQLITKFRPEDRMVQEVDQEIANTRTALERAIQLTGQDEATDINPVYQALEIDLGKAKAELAGLHSRRQTLATQTAAYHAQTMKLANATAGFDDFVRTQKEAEDNYSLYAKKAEEARIAELLDQQKIANVTIAETPVEPRLPSTPNVKLNIAMGCVLALFLSLGAAFGAERFRETIERPEELEQLTGLPVLATSHGD